MSYFWLALFSGAGAEASSGPHFDEQHQQQSNLNSRREMKLGAKVVLLLVVVVSIECTSGATQNHWLTSNGLQSLLDFDQFKRIFHKDYSHERGAISELVRQRIFLSRAMEVISASLAYVSGTASYYLSINSMSDFTQPELGALFMKNAGKQWKLALEEAVQLDNSTTCSSSTESRPRPKQVNRLKRSVQVLKSLSFDDLVEYPAAPSDEVTEIEQTSVLNGLSSLVPTGLLSSLAEKAGNFVTKSLPKFQQPTGSSDDVHIDLRLSGCFTPVRTQSRCGSCYAISTLSMFEYARCMQSNTLLGFSEQFVIDCGAKLQKSQNLRGCDGGSEADVSFMIKHWGLELRKNYAYTGKQDRCPIPDDFDKSKSGYLRSVTPTLGAIRADKFDKYLARSPIIVHVDNFDSLAFYGGGVADCWQAEEEEEHNHSVLIVGSGEEDGKPYWIVRNSWGPGYGEQGYIRLSKSTNCIEENAGLISIALLKNQTLAELNQNYDGTFIRQKSQTELLRGLSLRKPQAKEEPNFLTKIFG